MLVTKDSYWQGIKEDQIPSITSATQTYILSQHINTYSIFNPFTPPAPLVQNKNNAWKVHSNF